MTLGKLLVLSVSPFSQLSDGENNSTYLIGLFWGLSDMGSGVSELAGLHFLNVIKFVFIQVLSCVAPNSAQISSAKLIERGWKVIYFKGIETEALVTKGFSSVRLGRKWL